MHGGGRYAYAEVDGWRALRLPYLPWDGGLHADVVLPPEGSPSAADPRTRSTCATR